MINGFDNLNETVSDFAAKRVLGMNGSLRGYIETGNAYDKRYYKPAQTNDEYVTCKKEKKDSLLKNVLSVVGGISLVSLSIFGLHKFKVFNKISSLFKNIPFKNPINKPKFISDIQDKIKNFDIKTKFSGLKTSVSGFFKNFFDKFKRKPN